MLLINVKKADGLKPTYKKQPVRSSFINSPTKSSEMAIY